MQKKYQTLNSHKPLYLTLEGEPWGELFNTRYRKIYNIRRTKSENLSDCCFFWQLPLANPLKPGVKLRMKM